MTLRTEKGGRCRDYTCAIKARQGETICNSPSVPMENPDNPLARHIAEPNKRCAETGLPRKRIYDAIEAGIAAPDNPGAEGAHREPEGVP